MSVVSYSFLLFLLIACMVYYIVPKKWQWVVLLAAGIVFYAGAGMSYLAVVGLTALVVYGCSLLMQKNLDQQEEFASDAEKSRSAGRTAQRCGPESCSKDQK
ncbi:mBOAT family protein [Firmicutes bacterium CAG:194]|nr:mBOAT family protein [Firmicutes bacterium CAG:194]